jgi:hypothetical protein
MSPYSHATSFTVVPHLFPWSTRARGIGVQVQVNEGEKSCQSEPLRPEGHGGGIRQDLATRDAEAAVSWRHLARHGGHSCRSSCATCEGEMAGTVAVVVSFAWSGIVARSLGGGDGAVHRCVAAAADAARCE